MVLKIGEKRYLPGLSLCLSLVSLSWVGLVGRE